jgi:hypothetical protein
MIVTGKLSPTFMTSRGFSVYQRCINDDPFDHTNL